MFSAYIAKVKQWLSDKWGRIVTTVGAFLMAVQAFDLQSLRTPLADVIGDTWAGRLVSGTALLCFALSFLRHQAAATKIASFNASVPVAPPANPPSDVVKLLFFVMFVCSVASVGIAMSAEVPTDPQAASVAGTIPGHPVTAIVVTQCNLIVAVYMTMEDGRLLRFDQKDGLAYDTLLSMAYSATHSERVETACDPTHNGIGLVGYERHEPI